jgi:hypothetical protein
MKEIKKFIVEIEYIAEINGEDVPDHIAEDIKDKLERNQEGCYSCADLDVNFSEVISVTETTNMKTTFTLQDILSIKKDTWLEFIKSKMSDDQKKAMEHASDRWKLIETANNEELLIDQYSVNIASKNICLNFYDDHLFLTHCGTNEDFIKFNASNLKVNDLMKVITQLVIVLYDLNAGDPCDVANKVTSMLNELINN